MAGQKPELNQFDSCCVMMLQIAGLRMDYCVEYSD